MRHLRFPNASDINEGPTIGVRRSALGPLLDFSLRLQSDERHLLGDKITRAAIVAAKRALSRVPPDSLQFDRLFAAQRSTSPEAFSQLASHVEELVGARREVDTLRM